MAKARKTAKKDFVWNPGEVNDKQQRFLDSTAMFTCYGGAKGGGKATTNDTLICTPYGWVKMGDIRVGDIVTGADGKPAYVMGVFPQGEIPTYRVTFADGGSLRVSGEHLWKARVTGKQHKVNGKRYTRDRWEVLTTEQILIEMGKLRSNQSVVIPLCKPVMWPERELPVKPYTLGALIGDGSCQSSIQMTIAEEEIADNIRADGYRVEKWSGKYKYGIYGIFSQIRELGLNKNCYEKRVPEMYLNGCIEDRLEILRGLMDTDGYADVRGHCSYTSVCRGLADDVQYLVRSLGGKASVSVKNRKSGLSYEVNIRMPDSGITNADIFKLERKAARCRGKKYNGGISDVTRRIVSIEPDGTAECTCITVSNDEHLYVAEGFTVTHNSHIVRIKAIGGALFNPGISILMMRKTYNELEENLIRPILKELSPELYSYNATTHLMTFQNGSTIKFGHWQGDESEHEYNGLQYDWIFIDEATQFTERSFNFLGGCLRGTSPYPKRMYLTCNPGGVGHAWVKRLFIDRDYHRYPDDPERDEHAENYNFIFATVEDNKWLLESSPLYLKNLASMPEDLRRAYRYGDWDAIGGNFFPEFRENKHTTRPFRIPDHWPRFRSFDYGLDLFVCLWWAVDEDGRAWCYRSYEHEKLIVQEAAKAILDNTLPHEKIIATYAPPDMWNRQKDTGRTMAEIFMLNGVNVVKTDNNRVQGHMIMKDMMSPIPLHDVFIKSMYKGKPPEKLPGFIVFNTCDKLISDIKSIQADDKNPNDCAKEPHDITHTVDAARYFLVTRTLKAEVQLPLEDEEDEGQRVESYEEFMCGTGDGNYLV